VGVAASSSVSVSLFSSLSLSLSLSLAAFERRATIYFPKVRPLASEKSRKSFAEKKKSLKP